MTAEIDAFRAGLRAVGPGAWIEIVGLRERLRPVGRFSFPAEELPTWEALVHAAGLHGRRARYVVTSVADGGLGNRVVQRKPADTCPTGRLVYFASHDLEILEEHLRLDTEDESSASEGLRLGYPTCCVQAYETVRTSGDWLKSLLEASWPERPSWPAVCNRLAMLFGRWALLPDYFPCQLDCLASCDFAGQVIRTLHRLGLRTLADRVLGELARPILLIGGTLYQLPHGWTPITETLLTRSMVGVVPDTDRTADPLPFDRIVLDDDRILLLAGTRIVEDSKTDACKTRLIQYHLPEGEP